MLSETGSDAASPLLETADGNLLDRLIARVRTASRRKRSALFRAQFEIAPETRILDLGGWDGTHIRSLLAGSAARAYNVYVADIERHAVESAADRFGFVPVLLDEDGRLDFADGFFDIVFCSSVLEHVTVPKAEIWTERSGRRFRERAVEHQQRFAAELRRVAKGYFVQVPNRWFPVETHSWLPFLSYLPRPLQCRLIALANRYWIKKTDPDFYLPSPAEMHGYFPEAKLERERAFGVTKSLIAIRSDG